MRQNLANSQKGVIFATLWENTRHIGIGLWCNGSTTGFGSVCLGSNPGKPTTKNSSEIPGCFCFIPSRHIIQSTASGGLSAGCSASPCMVSHKGRGGRIKIRGCNRLCKSSQPRFKDKLRQAISDEAGRQNRVDHQSPREAFRDGPCRMY